MKEVHDIGVIGTGRMGTRLARMFAETGRSVVIASRDITRAAEVAEAIGGQNISGGSYADALRANAVLPAVFSRDGLLEILVSSAEQLSGKLLIDISNPFNDDYSDFHTAWDSSNAEELAEALPEARIVGAFKNVFWEVFDQPTFYGGQVSDVLMVGDDDGAKRKFLELTRGTPFRYLDAGPLQNARTIERLTMITGRLGRELGTYPRMNWKLL